MASQKSSLGSYALITGGAGFVGSNLAERLLSSGEDVVLFDNLSRPGVEENVKWLQKSFGEKVRLVRADVRDRAAVREHVRGASQVFHFAAQVAVTTSLLDPRGDFEVNAGGALNVLEAIRELEERPPLLFTSTNKVYGALEDVTLRCQGGRYEPCEDRLRERGIDETRQLDFHSPYGCSKGTADQYILDYARSFGLPAAVFRMSCIYGPRQFGTEDQGWVAHFLISAHAGKSLTVYGDGKQVRDVLFVEDLVDAFLLARDNIARISGQAFNIGGGPSNVTSLVELIAKTEQLTRRTVKLEHASWRVGDQRYYVSDHTRFTQATGWRPRVAFTRGLERLHEWLLRERFRSEPSLAAVARSAGARALGSDAP